jgi:hypothetical protein
LASIFGIKPKEPNMRKLKLVIASALVALASHATAQVVTKVVDIPTRPGISQRMIVLSPPEPKAAVVLFAGGHGGLQLSPNGSMQWGAGNFWFVRASCSQTRG